MGKIVVVCLARAGSKRIKNKNSKKFCGKPLIEWTLDIMNQLEYEKYIFTDCNKIKKICEKYPDITVRDKQYENNEGIHHTELELKEYNKIIGADVMILLQPTSPLRDINKIKEWIEIFLYNNDDIGLSTVRFDKYLYDQYGGKVNFMPLRRNYNCNKRINQYVENGSFYIFKTHMIDKNHITNSTKLIPFVDRYDLDLDSKEQWEKYEILWKGGYYENKNNS
jgi:CMP-N-acetylneuraminic acid synthetase